MNNSLVLKSNQVNLIYTQMYCKEKIDRVRQARIKPGNSGISISQNPGLKIWEYQIGHAKL